MHPECGQVAFYMDRMPHPGMVVSSEGVTLLDGNHPEPIDRIVCGSCGQFLKNWPRTQDIHASA
jgi:hypothetical protein